MAEAKARYEARLTRRHSDIEDLVSSLGVEELRTLVVRMAIRSPSLVFDIMDDATEVADNGDPDNERHHPPDDVGLPDQQKKPVLAAVFGDVGVTAANSRVVFDARLATRRHSQTPTTSATTFRPDFLHYYSTTSTHHSNKTCPPTSTHDGQTTTANLLPEDVSVWCRCDNCRHMPSAADQLCCRMQPRHCLSRRAELEAGMLAGEVRLQTKVGGMQHTDNLCCGGMGARNDGDAASPVPTRTRA